MSQTLGVLDAAFLELEQLEPGALMSIGGVMVFDPPANGSIPSVEEVRAGLAGRLGALPRYAQRLSEPHVGGLAWPHWVDDEQFDIRDHVHHGALPAPGGLEQLCDWTGDYFSHPLDRSRPLWEMVLLEGLEHGRWAIGHKTHHCLVDGVGSVDVVSLLLDREPSPPPPAPTQLVRSRDGLAGGTPLLPNAVRQAAHAGVQAAAGAVHAALHPRDALERSRALAELIVRDGIVAAPRTSLNVPIGQGRRFATVRIPLAECKAIGRELHASVNDVLLAACAYGLRHLLLERGERPPSRGLRAMVPTNLREASERLALGNRVSSLFVELPVTEPSLRALVQRIGLETARLKQTGAARGPTTLLDLGALAPPVVVEAALARTRFSTRLFNVTITNVPGPAHPLYAYGAPLREIMPVVPLAAEHAVGIAIFSYNGLVTLGINADCTAVPDIGVLAYGIEDGLEQLRSLLPRPPLPVADAAAAIQ